MHGLGQQLRRGRHDLPRLVGREPRLPHPAQPQHGQHPVRPDPRRPRRGPGDARVRRREQRRLGGGRAVAGRQIEAEGARFRHADGGADEPFGAELDHRVSARAPQRRSQQHLPRISEGRERPLGLQPRCRPGHRPGGDAGRQAEGQVGRDAGIAGIAPVAVPTGRQPQPQRHPDRPAGGDRVGIRHHRRGGAGAVDRHGFRRQRRPLAEHCQKQGQDRQQPQQDCHVPQDRRYPPAPLPEPATRTRLCAFLRAFPRACQSRAGGYTRACIPNGHGASPGTQPEQR